MKDFIQIWGRVSGKSYSSVSQHDREMRDLSNNRLRPSDIDTSTFDANFAECEGLNNIFDEATDFNGKKEAIINRLFEKRKKGHVTRQPKNLFLLLMLGFFGLGAGCFILLVHPYDILFKLKAVLSDGGEIYEMWRKPEVELYTKIYLFNVTNADDYLAGRADKLQLQEVGPYVYREKLEHKNVTFNSNGTLSAVPIHPLTWDEELSQGNKETDKVIMPNIALLSIANVVANGNIFTRMGLNALISSTNTKALVEMTAKEFMFGYESSLVTLGNSFMPGWIKFDKLGLIDRMYDFEGDFETVFTGEDDVSNSGLLDTYRGSTDLPQWDGKHCSNIQYASDGTKFKSRVGRNDSILFYRKSLCRPAPLVAVEEGVKGELHGYRYTFPEHMLDNGKYNEENKCYCRNGHCLPEGLIDVTECYYGFPIALSYPHFYKGDERLFKHVEGLTPNMDQHETKFWIQPDSGLPLDVSSKFQINMALQDVSSVTNADKFANVYLPLLWFDICMFELPTSMAYKFKMYLNVLPIVEKAAMYLLFAIGSFLVLIAVYRLAFKVMFKSFDYDKKHTNIMLGTDLWTDNEKIRRNEKEDLAKSGIYVPCEVPLNEDSSDDNLNLEVLRPKIVLERQGSGFLKLHGDRIKEISQKLNDKVYDSVGSLKDKIRDIPNVKHIFETEERRGSLINNAVDNSNTNDGFKSDDDDDAEQNDAKAYQIVNSSDDEDCHLEVIDDGSDFEMMKPNVDTRTSNAGFNIQRMNNLEGATDDYDDDLIINLSDLKIDE